MNKGLFNELLSSAKEIVEMEKNTNMTTHELAALLLNMDNVEVIHHYSHWDDFDDYPLDYHHKVKIVNYKGRVYLSYGDIFSYEDSKNMYRRD